MLENLLRYLNVEIDEGRLDCIEAYQEGNFHRGEPGEEDQEDQEDQTEPHRDQTDPFTEELHKLVDQNIVRADRLLRQKTGRGLPVDKYQNFNIELKY